MTKLQLDVFCSAQILLVKTGMELTRNAKAFRTQFKKQMGLPRNATNREVLIYIGGVYKQNNIFEDFVAKLERHNMLELLDEVQYV